MGGFGNCGGRDKRELSWTNEALPLEVRRELLDKALEDLRIAKAAASAVQGAAGSPRPSQPGLGRNPPAKKDKPQA